MGCSVGTVSGTWKECSTGIEGRSVHTIHCGKWICEECRKRKAKRAMARALTGGIAQQAKVNGFREEYNFKLLTLTCPGIAYREQTSKDEAYKELQSGYTKLVKALRHRGWFDYLRVCEPQRDCYPHFHVLLVGIGIRRKQILAEIVKLWNGIYGLGYIKINALRRGEGGGIIKAIKYLLKYLFKGPYQGDEIQVRIFSASRGALGVFVKDKVWAAVRFRPHTSVEYVVRQILGMELEHGESRNEKGEIESWEKRFVPIAGVPF